MPASRPVLPAPPSHPSAGDVLHFSRWHDLIAISCLPTALILGASGVICLVAAPWPAVPWLLRVLGGVTLLEGLAMLAAGWHILTHKPRLVLGKDRVQCWVGKRLHWDLSYGDIAEINLAVPVHLLFRYRMTWTRVLGFRLRSPERFDEAYPRLRRARALLRRQTGCDLGLSTLFAVEPQERCLEALLRCYHRFRAAQPEDARVGPSS